ncbi:DUF2963 domain-containing protein, partial [Candidatus Phytoplasma pruni]|nr:hypothetical protein [Candidatus Phytoplasma pruni]
MNYKEVIRKHKKIILLVGLGLLTLLTACTAVLIFKKLNNKNNNNLQNEAPIEVKNPTSEQLPTKKETEEVTLNQKNALKKQVLNIAQDYRNAKGMTIQDVSDEQLENKITSQQNSRPSSSLEELTITTKQMVDEVQLSKALNIAQDYREQKQITVEEVSDQNLRSTIQNQQTPTSALEVLTQTAKQLVDNRLLERTNLRNLALPAAQEYRQQQNITVEEVSDGQLTNAIQTKQTEKPTSILDELIQTTKTLINDKKVEKTLTIAQDYREKQEITPEEVTDQCFKNAIQIELNKEPTTSLEILISSAKKLVNDKNLSKTILMAKEYRNNKGITIEEVKDEKLEEVIQDKQSQNSTALSNELFEPAKNILDHFTVESNDNGKRITKRKQIDQDLIEYINEYDSNGKLIKKFEYNQEGKLNNTFEYFSNEESLQKEIKRVKYKADGITPHYNHTSSWSKGFNAQEKQTHLYKYKSNGEIDWSKSNTATFDE